MSSKSKNGGKQPLTEKEQKELVRQSMVGNRHERRKAKALLKAKRCES